MKRENKTVGRVLGGAITLITVLVISSVLAVVLAKVGIANVSGESMLPTLNDGSMILYKNNLDVERFDVILVGNEVSETILVKRVIGMPGDDLSIINGILYINNEQYDEPYVLEAYNKVFKTESLRVVLGADEYFIMGDNRDNSKDSRDTGPIFKDHILGVVTKTVRKGKHVETEIKLDDQFSPPKDDKGGDES